MTEVIRHPLGRQDRILTSVFAKGSIRKVKQNRKPQSKTAIRPEDVESSLYEKLKIFFGIGEEDITYGVEAHSEDGFPFKAPLFALDGSIESVRKWANQDHEALKARLFEVIRPQDLRRWQQALETDVLKKIIAASLYRLVPEYISWAYKGCYTDSATTHLEYWVEHVFAGTISLLLHNLNSSDTRIADKSVVSHDEIQKWQDIALTQLGALRVDEMFDMIVEWDDTVNGIDDLKKFVTNPATRSYLTTNFAEVLSTRLLHPGASTVEILQLYISIIRAFRKLDPRGVLLDRVARKVRRYLRERDDTVKVIVTGLLSEPIDENGEQVESDPETLTELAVELSRRNAEDGKIDDSEFDWNNMNWMPDPVDAAPDYMKSKNTDIIGSLTSLFESKDVFVQELQTTLADRLLKNKSNFDQEISVLEHLKIRFGDTALQGCEVMLRDVLDSRKLNNVIRQDQGMNNEPLPSLKSSTELHAKILSRLFWPPMSDHTFKVPDVITGQQQLYEKGFESLKQSRKLTWVNTVGQVEVELELEDRVFCAEVLPWQASVIYAFQDTSKNNATRSVDELSSQLEMTSALVRSACIFWVSKRILSETAKDEFMVLERLPEGDDEIMSDPTGQQNAATAAAKMAAEQAAKEVEEAERKQKMAIYHQFIISMLTNQGAMPLPRIAMMLGIVVPGGFPFSNEELKEFLAGMIKEDVLEIGPGGAYKIAT